MKVWIALIIFALLVAIFAVQNAHPVPVHFLVWVAPRVSLSLLIILSILLGAAIGALAGLWDKSRRRSLQSKVDLASKTSSEDVDEAITKGADRAE